MDEVHQWDSWFTAHVCVAAMLAGARKHAVSSRELLGQISLLSNPIHRCRHTHAQVPPAAVILR